MTLPQPARSVDPEPSFPLHHRQGVIAMVADDPRLLETIAAVMQYDWRVESFLRSKDCLNRLQQDPPRWESDLWAQHRLVEAWREGAPILPNLVRYWAENPSRHDLVKVCVCDHHMPEMDALELIADLVPWPGRRILLTEAPYDEPVKNALVTGMIDRVVRKQETGFAQAVHRCIADLLQLPNPRYEAVWASTLKPEQQELLRRPGVTRALARLAQGLSEWVVMGDPFGVLGLRYDGAVRWLQLEPRSALPELAKVAREAGLAMHAAEILSGSKLVNAALFHQLGLRSVELLDAHRIGDADLLGALTHVGNIGDMAEARPCRQAAQNQSSFQDSTSDRELARRPPGQG